jgi:hypothetical protein
MTRLLLPVFLALATFSGNSHAGDAYTGEKILDYLSEGTHEGAGCQVTVRESSWGDEKSVSVEIRNDEGDFRMFNSSILEKVDLVEEAGEKSYVAAFTMIPDDQYTGRRRTKLEITDGVVTVTAKRRFLGIWIDDGSLSCETR